MNKLLQKLQEKTHVSNAWITIPSAWTAELLCGTGLDSLCIDAQHGLATDFADILSILQATRHSSTAVVVRMPANEPAFTMRLLDAGVDAIITPMIKSVEETEYFVQSCYYPPLGNRSYGPLRASRVHSNYFENAEDLVCPIIMIETKEALEQIDDIVEVKCLKGLYVGPWDLSLDMGISPLADFTHPVLIEAFEKIASAAKRKGIFTCLHCSSPEEAIEMRKYGFRFYTIFNDSRALQKAAEVASNVFNESR